MRIFPPPSKPTPKGYWRDGLATSQLNSYWGKLAVTVQRLRAKDGHRSQMYRDASLDESGWSPEALALLLELASCLAYEEASRLAERLGLTLSSSSLALLTSTYAQSCEQAVSDRLSSTATAADAAPLAPSATSTSASWPSPIRIGYCGFCHLCAIPAINPAPPTQHPRVMVLQLDGVYVLGRPEAGSCPGIELKSAVLYPCNSPSERWLLAGAATPDTLLPQLLALLDEAGVTPKDTLIGLGDGAAWIDGCFALL